MQNNKNEYDKINIKKFINKINKINNNPYNNINSIENKYLTFIKYFYDKNTVNYGHIIGNDNISCYNNNSPFKLEDLRHFGPFSCLNSDEYISGIQTPYIYIGGSHTYISWYNEDMNFHSINHLLYGNNKIWYCISSLDYTKVMKYFYKQFKYYYTDCLTPLQHKNCLMDPYIFTCLGINVYYIIQKPGDIVITPPGGLYFNFNESFNICQTVNVMTFNNNQWLLSLSSMLIKSYNYHDCTNKQNTYNTPCICCNKQCINPHKRFICKCKFCDPLKCPCDLNIFYDINILAQRVRNKYKKYEN
eukprot:494164_1